MNPPDDLSLAKELTREHLIPWPRTRSPGRRSLAHNSLSAALYPGLCVYSWTIFCAHGARQPV